MDDKKEYKTVLKALDATATLASTLKQLGGVHIDTEDGQLRTLLVPFCNALRQLDPHGRRKVRLANLSKVREPALYAQLEALAKYCIACRDAGMPQWELLARRAGWTPPTQAANAARAA